MISKEPRISPIQQLWTWKIWLIFYFFDLYQKSREFFILFINLLNITTVIPTKPLFKGQCASLKATYFSSTSRPRVKSFLFMCCSCQCPLLCLGLEIIAISCVANDMPTQLHPGYPDALSSPILNWV